MRKQDLYGCDTTIGCHAALAQWNMCVHGFLAHAAVTGDALGKALAIDPNFALGHACKGLFSLLLGRRELTSVAHGAFLTAKAIDREAPLTGRERHFINALGAWLSGKPTNAVEHMEAVLVEFPQDPLAMKLSHAIRFMLGDLHGMRDSIETLLPAYEGHAAEGYINGCYAFTLEETGDYGLAEKCGRKALDLASDDAWGLHAMTHIFDMTGRARDGLEWIRDKDEAWAHCNNFRYHVWWHIALMHLDLGEYDKVLELYDTGIRNDHTDDYRDIANGTSILMRLEFDGVDVGDRWQELAELSAARTDDNCVAFADLHYMMALCNAPDQAPANRLLSNMQACAEVRHGCELTQAIKGPGALAAEGLEAFRDHNFSFAYECLAKARPELIQIGGSHAQRDVFERLAIEAALRGNLMPQAKNLLRERDLHRGHQDGYSQSRWDMIEGRYMQSGGGLHVA